MPTVNQLLEKEEKRHYLGLKFQQWNLALKKEVYVLEFTQPPKNLTQL